ncbi:MAG TPA: hypothetical protein PK765_04105 [bacterium]|nr:hypothetical protein [bacterium]
MVRIDDASYAIECRKDGWTVVPPISQSPRGMGVRIGSMDRDGIASALYYARKYTPGGNPLASET